MNLINIENGIYISKNSFLLSCFAEHKHPSLKIETKMNENGEMEISHYEFTNQSIELQKMEKQRDMIVNRRGEIYFHQDLCFAYLHEYNSCLKDMITFNHFIQKQLMEKVVPSVGDATKTKGNIKCYELVSCDKEIYQREKEYLLSLNLPREKIVEELNKKFTTDSYIFLANKGDSSTYFDAKQGFNNLIDKTPATIEKIEQHLKSQQEKLKNVEGDSLEVGRIISTINTDIKHLRRCRIRNTSVYKYKLLYTFSCYGAKEVFNDICNKEYNSNVAFGGYHGLFCMEDGNNVINIFKDKCKNSSMEYSENNNGKYKLLKYTLPK